MPRDECYRGWFAANGSSFGYKGKSASHILPGLTAYSRCRLADAHQMNRSLGNCTRRWQVDSGSPVNSNEPSATVAVRNSPVRPTAVTAIEAAGLASSRLSGETPGYGSVPMNPKSRAGGCPMWIARAWRIMAAATIAGRVGPQEFAHNFDSMEFAETKYSTPRRNGYPQAVDCALV